MARGRACSAGMIMPSRDMLVRAAAPPGAVGRTFGIVTIGLQHRRHDRAVDVRLHAMDQGAPQWVFGISVILMIAIAVAGAWLGDRHVAAKRRERAGRLEAVEQVRRHQNFRYGGSGSCCCEIAGGREIARTRELGEELGRVAEGDPQRQAAPSCDALLVICLQHRRT